MILDLLATSNNVSYNIKLAQLLGLHTAIYLSELLNINTKAIKKDKVTDSFFTIDRKYLESRTTFDLVEQERIERQLLELNILHKTDNDNSISLDIPYLTSLLSTDDEKILSNIKLITKKSTSKRTFTKRELECMEMKKYIVTNNSTLRKAYEDWIDGVYANPKGFLSKKAVELAQTSISSYCNGNLNMAIDILNIATVGGYREMQWAIDRYKQNYNPSYRIPANQEIKSSAPQTMQKTSEVLF